MNALGCLAATAFVALIVYATVLAIGSGAWPLAALLWAFIACWAIDEAREGDE